MTLRPRSRGRKRAGQAAAMWSHAPQMHHLMAEKAPFRPRFEREDTRDLAAYLRGLAASEHKIGGGTSKP